MYRHLFWVVLLFTSIGKGPFAQTPTFLSEQDIAKAENLVRQVLEENKAPPERYFVAYLLGARALLAHKLDKKALEYLEKAKSLPVEMDKSEVYLEMVAIASRSSDKKKLLQVVTEARSYFSANSSYNKPIYQQMLDYYEGKNIDKNSALARWMSFSLNERDLEQKIKDKKYQDAILLLNGESLKDSSNLGLQVTYDLLVSLNGMPVAASDLLCKKTFDKYPGSYTYSMLLCGALIEHRQSQTIDGAKLIELEKYFSLHFQNKAYLLSALRDLSNKVKPQEVKK